MERDLLPFPRLTSSIPSVVDKVERLFAISIEVPRFSVALSLETAFEELDSARSGVSLAFSL
jgi:hypothetical protein